MPDTLQMKVRGITPTYRLFQEAKDLAINVFINRAPEAIQAISTGTTYFTDHGQGHTERVITKLNELNQILTPSDQLNDKEAFILLVAAYYHDMSMFIGRISGEDPITTREEHHTRSAEIIQKLNDNGFLHIPAEELDCIKKVIKAHRVTNLETIPIDQGITGSTIKTRLLGALLRIADACDCDRSRAPKSIYDLFYGDIPENSRAQWTNLFSVTDVKINPRRSAIIISFNFSGTTEEIIRKFRLAHLLKKKLEKELRSIENIIT